MQPAFEIYEADGWRFQLIDGNGEPIANSEPYSSQEAAWRGAENVQTTAPLAVIRPRAEPIIVEPIEDDEFGWPHAKPEG